MPRLLFALFGCLLLASCNGIEHQGCANDPAATGYQVTSVKSVLHTCN